DASYDVVVYDPPHLADGGEASIMARRYGTVKGTDPVRALIVAGCAEAWRIARVGILVKATNSGHGGEFNQLSLWMQSAVPVRPYAEMHTFRVVNLKDGKWTVQRLPHNNGVV